MSPRISVTHLSCLSEDLKVIYVHVLLKIVGNYVLNVQIRFISNDPLKS